MAMREYVDWGHAEPVPPSELHLLDDQVCYIPVHFVMKESSSTTKCRHIFEASASSSNGISLNDQLLAGPSLYPRLTTVINQFRRHKVVFTADISKMFRGIHLHPDDKNYHHFLMRDSNNSVINYKMAILTFSVISSPFLATRVIHQAADDMTKVYLNASGLAKHSFYVDDVLTGASDVDSALNL